MPVRRTRVKICGITRPEDGVAAVELGADAIGLNFWRPSPRYVEVAAAAEIASALPPLATVVGVFVDPPAAEVERVLAQVRLGLIQFHGSESPDACTQYATPYIKALPVRDGGEGGAAIWAAMAEHKLARGFLLDTFESGKPGGTGRTFDWSLIPGTSSEPKTSSGPKSSSESTASGGEAKPIILAGGLSATNVGTAIEQIRPYAVDVSGGVERAPGIKDHERIRAFIDEVNRVAAA